MQEDPWRIESLADFDEFAADPNYWSGFTRLETDVNLAGRTYTTAVIAPDTDNSKDYFQGTAFTGVFDGNDHKIRGLTIDDGGAGNDFLGLFGYIHDGEVKNLRLEGGSVRGDKFVGGLVGGNGGWGTPGGAISNCYSTGNVNGYDCVGGLVGENWNGSVSNCYSTGSVSAGYDVGGLVGDNVGIVSNCHSTGNVSGGYYIGGLVGANGTNCIGCVPNYPYPGYIINSYSTGDVNGVDDVGGLVGANEDGSISNCYSTGDVSGSDSYVGGLVGSNWFSANVSNCYSTGDVNGEERVGGLVGANFIMCPGPGCYRGSILNSYSTGSVQGTSYVGGLVGDNYSILSNCYSTGDVNGVDYVGGLVGYNLGTVSNCYSTSNVNGLYNVGGLVGQNGYFMIFPFDVSDGSIFNSYSSGSVQGNSNVGGLVGYDVFGEIERSFWDVQTSGEPNMCGAQSEWATGCDPNCGKTAAEMQTRSTFTDAGWDFVDIWLINEGATYPVLRQETRSDLNGDGGVNLLDFAIFAGHWLEGKGD